jgi:predicted cobalt transporter CbtA
MAAGLGVCLLLRFAWAKRAARDNHETWREATTWNEVLYVSAHAALGGGVGLLFWLSWGFTALVGVSWWQRGIVFGVANALVFTVLPLLIVRSLLPISSAVWRVLLVETLCTYIAASLACSWAWSQAL